MGWIRRAAALASLFLVIASPAVPDARAQAWVDHRGSLAAGLGYDYGFASAIAETDGDQFDDVYVTNSTATLDAEYVPIERLAIVASLPFMALKYDKGKSGSAYDPHGPYDDGDTHLTLQDLSAGVRYMVIAAPIGLSLSLGGTLPIGDYAVKGSAAAGRHLKQGHVGIAAGAFLPFLPRAFVHGTYELTISEKFDATAATSKYGQTRSDASVQLGYFVLDGLDLFLGSTLRVQHDGVDFADYAMLTPDEQEWHDGILREAVVLVGPGVSYEVTDRLQVSLSYSRFVGGHNTLNSDVVSLHAGWSIL